MILFLFDVLLAAMATLWSLILRYSSFLPNDFWQLWPTVSSTFYFTLTSKVLILMLLRPSRGIWVSTSLQDLKMILQVALYASILSVVLLFFSGTIAEIPRTFFVIDWMSTVFFLGGTRVLWRMMAEGPLYGQAIKKVAIVGAGLRTEQLLKHQPRLQQHHLQVCALFDDDPKKWGRMLCGVPIYPLEKINPLLKKLAPEELIMAMPMSKSGLMRDIIAHLDYQPIKLKIAPTESDHHHQKPLLINDLKPLEIEDLLGRASVNLDGSHITHEIRGKTVFITGAGGSIGSELVRQVLKFDPSQVVMIDHSEYFIFHLEQELKQWQQQRLPQAAPIKLFFHIADVRDLSRIEQLILEHRPYLCLHAAAYKHVPLMEQNIREALSVNVLGTRNVLHCCATHGVARFLLISTDKAVRPSSVMGASKRLAELLTQRYAHLFAQSRFSIVRFGNVLASHGSVVPTFLQQIKKGGPITVTHREMTRYFMSIPEATQLVLLASTLGQSGQILVLDMGEPVKIIDLAKQMIRLAGLTPYQDIDIQEIGMRPGEKLHEELFHQHEELGPTNHKSIFVTDHQVPTANFGQRMDCFLDEFKNWPAEQLHTELLSLVNAPDAVTPVTTVPLPSGHPESSALSVLTDISSGDPL